MTPNAADLLTFAMSVVAGFVILVGVATMMGVLIWGGASYSFCCSQRVLHWVRLCAGWRIVFGGFMGGWRDIYLSDNTQNAIIIRQLGGVRTAICHRLLLQL